ncbi:MAG: tRNA pseudouridine synthase A, partial [Clostridia bacterium]
MRVLAKIEYDGTDFCGWQSQPKKRTVQTEIENALAKVYGEKVVICASGRTDGGVHALAQCAHFDLPTTRKISPENLRNAINVKLPQDVKIISLNEVGGDF